MVARWMRRLLQTAAPAATSVARKRVFGICAHVDAGKTTVSERMLYYAGALNRMGNVDSGDTTMDFLPEERERGITVNSAAISFDWRDSRLFLVDSPGHLDFTYEVQRALRVMDGAVIVVDSVAGVQPQTETVWRQADQYSLPRIVLVNKMDRDGADFCKALASLRERLGPKLVVLHAPIVNDVTGEWTGFVDLVTMERVEREPQTVASSHASRPTRHEARTSIPGDRVREGDLEARALLVEALADVDDAIMEAWVTEEHVDSAALKSALRRATVAGAIVPVLCGAALKNTGVQALLDAVVDYLPCPTDRESINVSEIRPPVQDADLLALAFKVTHDGHRGQMVFLRAFCGGLEAQSSVPLLNISNGKKEVPTALLRVMADSVEDAGRIETGDIFAATGMKHTETGDTITIRRPGKAARNAEQAPLQGVPTPPAVVAVAVEAESTSQQRKLDDALQQLLAEDPSLRLSIDSLSGETLLSGMGQLHLDVVIERLSKTLDDPIHVSKPRIAYRETITERYAVEKVYNKVIGATRHRAAFHLVLQPLPDHVQENEVLLPDELQNGDPDLSHLVRTGVLLALRRGALLGSPTLGVQASVLSTAAELQAASSSAALTACISHAAQSALAAAQPILLEPVMKVHCTVPDETMGAVIGELTHPTLRRGVVDIVRPADGQAEVDKYALVVAAVPLNGMLDWATRLRTVTKGRGDFSMEFASYQPLGEAEQARLCSRP
jgi:elongation factor G